MTTAKHTPGPWHVYNSNGIIEIHTKNFGTVVKWQGFDGIELTQKRNLANARLIAAAPDLLEFAEEVRRTGDTRLASMALAVIAKATGVQE